MLLSLGIDICYSQWFDALAAEARSAATTGIQGIFTVGFDWPNDLFSPHRGLGAPAQYGARPHCSTIGFVKIRELPFLYFYCVQRIP